MAENDKKPKLNIELPEEAAAGIYSNLAVITHSPTEFVTDFIQIMPGVPKAKVRSRVIMTPQHAKRFLSALEENLSKYESLFGEIKSLQRDILPLNFGAPKGEA